MKLVFIFLAFIVGCAPLPKTAGGFDHAPFRFDKISLTGCRHICVDKNSQVAFKNLDGYQKYCPRSAALNEWHCLEFNSRKKYVLSPKDWALVEHKFGARYSNDEVSRFLVRQEFLCERGYCNEGQIETLEELAPYIWSNKGLKGEE